MFRGMVMNMEPFPCHLVTRLENEEAEAKRADTILWAIA
jgi:hypothetical protein